MLLSSFFVAIHRWAHIFLDSKITADDDYSHEIKRCFAPWKKNYDQLRQHIKKQRHYFANKGLSSQGYGFPVVMYRCESWIIKKAERPRIDAFELCDVGEDF